MELSEYMVNLRKQVDKFEEKYRDGQRTQPDLYASDLDEGDWYEQFDAFLSMVD